jgi:hypothetical protein
MLHRFAAASAVASVIIAGGAIVSLLPPRWPAADARVLTTGWCFVPLAWGLWAMLAPARWVPRRLPVWGAILGLVAASSPVLCRSPPLAVRGTLMMLVGTDRLLLCRLMVLSYIVPCVSVSLTAACGSTGQERPQPCRAAQGGRRGCFQRETAKRRSNGDGNALRIDD